MKTITWTAALLLLFATSTLAQDNFVKRFLDRYRPPAAVAAATTAQLTPQSQLPVSVDDVIRLMIESNLDVQVNRLSPLTQQFLIDTLFRPFEPSLRIGANVDSSSQPAATILVATKSLTHNYLAEFSQSFATGLHVSVTTALTRSSDNNPFNDFNPAYFGTIGYSFTQNLLQNFGRDVNMHAIRVTRNNKIISDIQFELELIDLATNAQNTYWDLVGARENLKMRQQALDLAEQTLKGNERQVELGALAPIDLIQSRSNVAVREQDIVAGTFSADQVQDRMKRMITNSSDPAMVAGKLMPIDAISHPDPADLMPIEDAIKYALENRPELRQIELNVQNSDIDLQYAKNQLLPVLTVTGGYRQSGIGGRSLDPNTGQVIGVTGLADAFGQIFGFNYSGYNIGFNLQIPLSNKSAQAEYSRLTAARQTTEAKRTSLAQAIALQVRNAHSVVEMNSAMITAAEKTRGLAEERLAAEQRRLQLGGGQVRYVLEEEQNLTAAQSNEIQALVNYRKALADFDKAIGRTLKQHNVQIEKALKPEPRAGG